jgi:hypothetical protein
LSSDDLRERFFRERRLLLGVSVVLLAHQLLGITVGKSAETLGLHFEIDDPSMIWWTVWAVWLWTATCAAQQLNSIKPREEYPTDRDEETRDRLSDWVAVNRVRRDAIKCLRTIVPRELRPKFEIAFAERRQSDAPGGNLLLYTCVCVTARWQCNDAQIAQTKAFEVDTAMRAANWDVSGGSVGYEGGEGTLSRIVNVRIVPIQEERWIRIGSTAWTLLSTSFGTDYVVPFVIGAAPIVVVVWQVIVRGHHRFLP